MAKINEIIIQEIERFKNINGGDYTDYYIGITNNIDRRIVESFLNEHLAKGWYTKGNPFYSEECLSNNDACIVEVYFQALGMHKYNPRSKGKKDSIYIYCFKLDEHNKQMILNEDADTEMITTIKKFKEFRERNK